MWDELILFVAVGFTAQLVDGAIGMAYGLSGDRQHRHVPADRRRLLLLRRTVAVLGILEAA